MDPKYEKLPGIARDEPDVYETQEQQQNEQQHIEDDSSNVQKILTTQKEAFDTFNKSSDLNSRFADFSDAINSRFKIGYLIDKDNLEHDQIHESLTDRFNRIQKDLHDLKNDLVQIKNVDGDSDKQKVSKLDEADDISKQIDILTKEVSTLHLELAGAKFDSTKLDTVVKKKLLIDHLNDSKKALAKSEQKSVTSKPELNGDSITFKVFNGLDETSLHKLAKVSDIDQRLSKLESVIGTSQQAKVLSSLCASIDNKTLLGLVEHLENKVNLVDQQSLDLVESKLSWVLQKVQQLNEKKSLIEDNEKMNKISELYSITSNWKDVLTTLPNLTERLASLNDLHQQAFQFSSALTRLDCEQQTMKQTVQTNNDVLKQIKERLNENVSLINKSLDSLNARITSLASI